MASLLSKLEKGGVPAELVNLRFAGLLLDNPPNVVYGDVQEHPHHFLIGLGVTSVKMGLEQGRLKDGCGGSSRLSPSYINCFRCAYS